MHAGWRMRLGSHAQRIVTASCTPPRKCWRKRNSRGRPLWRPARALRMHGARSKSSVSPFRWSPPAAASSLLLWRCLCLRSGTSCLCCSPSEPLRCASELNFIICQTELLCVWLHSYQFHWREGRILYAIFVNLGAEHLALAQMAASLTCRAPHSAQCGATGWRSRLAHTAGVMPDPFCFTPAVAPHHREFYLVRGCACPFVILIVACC